MMKKILLICLFPILAFATEKNHFEGFVKVATDRELYVDWFKAAPGNPTVVLVNGLTYSTADWDRFTNALVELGIGVFRYDPIGMGKTLLKYAPITADIKIEDQVTDLHKLLVSQGLQNNVNLIGLSYGGGLGLLYATKYPNEIGNLIAMAPYTQPLESQDKWIQAQIWYTRQVQPWNPSTDDELYAFFYHQIVYSTYPTAEPVVLGNPYILEAVYHMGLGIRKFNACDIAASLPKGALHLVVAGRDQYIPRDVMDNFWSKVPDEAKASRTVISNSEHKIPEAVPHFAAALVKEILTNKSVFSNGRNLEADPYTGKISYKGGKLELPKE